MSNTCGLQCKLYTERFLGWCLNNKIIVLLTLLSFSLFVSTLTIAGQRNRLQIRYNELEESLVTSDATTPTTTASETESIATDPPEVTTEGKTVEPTTTTTTTTDPSVNDKNPQSEEKPGENTDGAANLAARMDGENTSKEPATEDEPDTGAKNVRSRRMIMGYSG